MFWNSIAFCYWFPVDYSTQITYSALYQIFRGLILFYFREREPTCMRVGWGAEGEEDKEK